MQFSDHGEYRLPAPFYNFLINPETKNLLATNLRRCEITFSGKERIAFPFLTVLLTNFPMLNVLIANVWIEEWDEEIPEDHPSVTGPVNVWLANRELQRGRSYRWAFTAIEHIQWGSTDATYRWDRPEPELA